MHMNKALSAGRICLTVGLVAAFAGCAPEKTTVPATTHNSTQQSEETAHRHESGPHGGVISDWGGGKYHVEFAVDHDKKEASVYVLGDDEKTPVAIKSSSVLLTINQPAFQVELQPAPQAGETDAVSRFTGTHDSLGTVQDFAGSIGAEVDGTPFVAEFDESEAGHQHPE